MKKYSQNTFESDLHESYHTTRRMGFSHTANALANMIFVNENIEAEPLLSYSREEAETDPENGAQRPA